jgi:nucleotide-binding universal stress UspA family protein
LELTSCVVDERIVGDMKILIAIDASEQSQLAVEEAAASFWPERTSIKVVTVVDNFLGVPVDDVRLAAAQKLVDAAVDKLRDSLAIFGGVEGLVIKGNPKAEIIRSASNWHTDLLIVGSRGRKGLSRIVLGSVSHTALMAVPCSVRIARRRPQTAANQRIILSLDESRDSARVVGRASLLRWPHGTEFLCVYALPTLTQYLHEEQNSHEIDKLAHVRNQQLEQARLRLDQMSERIKKRIEGVSARWEILDGDPRETIVTRAKEWNATLVMMGCKGKNWIDRIFVGSVSEAIATWADCSVEVIKH